MNSSIMVFSSALQDPSSHESFIKLQDTEIKLLENIKKCVTQRVKCDRDYANSLIQLCSVTNKFENPESFSSPVFQAWNTVVTELENIAKQIKTNADRMCTSTIEKLVALVYEKKTSRKSYIEERGKLELEMNKLKDQLQKQKTDYEKAITKYTLDKAKHEDAVAKGKTGKKLDDIKAKYYKTAKTVHNIHNDMVATLQEINIHQQDYLNVTLPGLLNYQQELQQMMTQQCKDILQEYASKTDFSSEDYVKCHSEINRAIGAINPSTEYEEFLEKHRGDPLTATQFQFDSKLLEEVDINLTPGEISLNDLTLENLKQSVSQYQTEIDSIKDKQQIKQQELSEHEEELNKLPPLNTMDDKNKLSYYAKKKLCQLANKDITELKCHCKKYEQLQKLVNEPVANLSGDPPLGCEFDSTSIQRTNNNKEEAPGNTSTTSSNSQTIEDKAQNAKEKFTNFKKSLADKFKKTPAVPSVPEPISKDYNDSQSKQDEVVNSEESSGNKAVNNAHIPPVIPAPASVNAIANELKARQKRNDSVASVGSGKIPPQPPAKPTASKYEQCEVSNENHAMKTSSNANKPIQEEEWFHGVLPREEVVRLLQQDGDYLVRESRNKRTGEAQYVLSVMWQEPKHFIIQSSGGQWRFEGNTFDSIQDLIRDQHSSGTAVTKKSQAILRRPILKESWELNNDDIQLGSKLGNGNFGDVFKGIFKGEEVAVKTCKETLSEEQKKKFLQEGRILQQYNHPNIVRFIGIAANRQPVMIVMEFVAGGALLQYLRTEGKKNPKRLTAKSMVKMCCDASAGMAYLEEKNCIHRDLAARNCLIGTDQVIKISDFGMSREEEEYTVSGGLKQIPIKWTAPEALNFGTYTSACDVWSFGILMWEVFSFGATPYPGLTNNQARERVDEGYRMPAPDGTPKNVHELMLKCWESEAKDRIKFEQVYKTLQKIVKGPL